MGLRQYLHALEDHVFGQGQPVLLVDDLGRSQADPDHLRVAQVDVDEVEQVGDLADEAPGVGAAGSEDVRVVREPVVEDFDALERALLGNDLQHVVDVHHLHFLDDVLFGLGLVGGGFRGGVDAVLEAVQVGFLRGSAVRFIRNLQSKKFVFIYKNGM